MSSPQFKDSLAADHKVEARIFWGEIAALLLVAALLVMSRFCHHLAR